MIHTVKGFRVVDETEVIFFFWNSLDFSVTQQIGEFDRWFSAISKSNLGVTSSLPLLPSGILDTSDLGDLSFGVISFVLLYSSWGSHGKYTLVVCHSLLQWITFCQNSPLWPIRLGWPYTVWLIASLSYTRPFTMLRQWSLKGPNSIRLVQK